MTFVRRVAEPIRSSLANRSGALLASLVAFVAATAGVAAAQDGGAAPAVSPDRERLQRAKRLVREGRCADALPLFKAEFAAKHDPDLLFSMGECHELLGDTVEAVQLYRQYLTSGLALRLAEAEARIKRLDSRGDPEPEVSRGARHVIVRAGEKSESCVQSCRRLPMTNPRRQGTATQFACFRGCPGATLKVGRCPSRDVPGVMCLDENRLLWPIRF